MGASHAIEFRGASALDRSLGRADREALQVLAGATEARFWKQRWRAGTPVAAHYRASGSARSKAEWIAKIGLVVEEGSECPFWLEMLADCEIVPRHRLEAFEVEACQ